MRILFALIVLALSGPALAQPQEVVPEGEISIAVGQVKAFRFPESLSRVDVITQGTIEATAQSDRQISIVGLAVGATQMFVAAPDGRRLYSATVTVTQERGHQVRIYGTGKNDDVNAGFISVYCHETGCGRPDKDLPAPNITVERVSRGPKDVR